MSTFELDAWFFWTQTKLDWPIKLKYNFGLYSLSYWRAAHMDISQETHLNFIICLGSFETATFQLLSIYILILMSENHIKPFSDDCFRSFLRLLFNLRSCTFIMFRLIADTFCLFMNCVFIGIISMKQFHLFPSYHNSNWNRFHFWIPPEPHILGNMIWNE